MTRYRFRGLFLLFLIGHATACATTSWQAPSSTASSDRGVSVADYIEENHPDRVRITTEDRTQYLLYSPSVKGTQIVSVDNLSVPIDDIVQFEVWSGDTGDGWSPFAVVGGILLGGLVLVVGFIALLIGDGDGLGN